MAEHLLQRFAAMASTSTAGPPSSTATLSQRVHHEPFGKYPVYGPGSGPDIYDDGGEFWQGETGAGFFPGGGPALPPPPPPPAPPFPYRVPYGKFGKPRFKGASVAVLTFIGFLFFLSVLQNYIRDYSTTNTPTVIVVSSGATKENPQQYPFLQKADLELSQESDDDGYSSYKLKAPQHSHSKRPKNHKRQSHNSVKTTSKQPAFSDLISVGGQDKRK
ncbi:uncharacterized protein LOC129717425 [Wyeomyia smithii]|uniref:uncharacterized protein LOC129717425 n=1 Tax=Wyeomyia smithii TaxID=174621 RepID=UPI002467BCFF|nr:uncharacterized protein LOC129717425 [Wyeomyia smithii]